MRLNADRASPWGVVTKRALTRLNPSTRIYLVDIRKLKSSAETILDVLRISLPIMRRADCLQ